MAFVNYSILLTYLNISILITGYISGFDLCKKDDRFAKLYSSDNECTEDIDCLDTEKCVNNNCAHVCLSECLGTCEICLGVNHTGVCLCKIGFVRNSQGICRISCVDSSDCSRFQECVKDENGIRRCECITSYVRDLYKSDQCELSRVCHNDDACPEFEECVNSTCIDACSNYNCTETNQGCLTVKHKATCVCELGYELTTDNKCRKIPCIVDSDCAAGEFCIGYPTSPRCECPKYYGRDFTSGGICRQKCRISSDCTKQNHWCKGKLCVPCDGRIC